MAHEGCTDAVLTEQIKNLNRTMNDLREWMKDHTANSTSIHEEQNRKTLSLQLWQNRVIGAVSLLAIIFGGFGVKELFMK